MGGDKEGAAPVMPESVREGFTHLQNEIGPEAAAPPPGQQMATAGAKPHSPEDWRAEVKWGFAMLQTLAPNWDLSAENPGVELAQEASCELLDKYFPGGLDAIDTWGPWAKLIAGGAIIVGANFDPDTGKIKPMRIKKEEGGEHGIGKPVRNGGGEPERENGPDETGSQ